MGCGTDQICCWLGAFVRGDDRSLALAGKLEVAIDEAFPDDEECQDLVLVLASYRPGGGDYLYDEDAIVPKCRKLMGRLCSS
jgi:hypothetical protein